MACSGQLWACASDAKGAAAVAVIAARKCLRSIFLSPGELTGVARGGPEDA